MSKLRKIIMTKEDIRNNLELKNKQQQQQQQQQGQ